MTPPIINRRMGTEFDQRRRDARSNGLHIAWITDTQMWSLVDDQPDHPDATSGGDLYFYTGGKKMDEAIAKITANPPHFTLHSGDMIERGRDFDFFMSYWDRLPGPNEMTLGNHDVAFTAGPGETLHDVAAEGFRHQDRPLIARSKFNQSFTVSGNGITVRMLILDTCIQPSGLHAASSKGYLHDDALAWVAAELAAAPEEIVLIVMHHGPHSWWSGRFDEADALALQAVVDADVAARPGRKIRGLFGHWHIHHHMRTFDNLGPNFPGYLAPCVIDLKHGTYLDLYVDRDGYLTWDTHTVRWTP